MLERQPSREKLKFILMHCQIMPNSIKSKQKNFHFQLTILNFPLVISKNNKNLWPNLKDKLKLEKRKLPWINLTFSQKSFRKIEMRPSLKNLKKSTTNCLFSIQISKLKFWTWKIGWVTKRWQSKKLKDWKMNVNRVRFHWKLVKKNIKLQIFDVDKQ